MGLCNCYEKQSPSVEALQCIQLYCRQKNSKQLQAEVDKNKLVLKIKLVEKNADPSYQFLESSKSTPIAVSGIVGELCQSGILLNAHNIYINKIAKQLLKLIEDTENTANAVVFIEQPLCQGKVNMAKLYEHTFKAVLIVNAQLQQMRKTVEIKSSIEQNKKMRIVMHWSRLKQRQMVEVIDRVSKQVAQAQKDALRRQ